MHTAKELESLLSENRVAAKDVDFAQNLVAAANGRGLSEKQAYWVDVLVKRVVSPQPARAYNFTGVYAMFAKAKAHLKRPKVNLRTETGEDVVLYLAGPLSRYPNVVNVASGSYDDKWYGRVQEDGEWQGRAYTPKEVFILLEELSSAPEETAARYGKLTGSCTFCSKKLSDARSTSVGYGPVCASRFGLKWGEK